MDKSLEILNAYISIEVDDSALEPLYREIGQALADLDIKNEISPRPHVSIAYTVGKTTLKDLDQIVSEIAEAPFIVEGQGIDIIPGKVIDKDFVALKLHDNDDFLYAQEFVAENCDIQTSFDGKQFIAHLSLFMIDKGLESIYQDLARVLEIYCQSIGSLKLKGKSISVFSAQRELLIQKKI